MCIQIFFLYGLFVAALPVDWGAVRVADDELLCGVAVEADVLQPAEGGLDMGEVQASPFVPSAGDCLDAPEPWDDLVLVHEVAFVYLWAVEQPVHFLVVFFGVGV